VYKIVLENLVNPLYPLVNNVIKVDVQIFDTFFQINSSNNIPKQSSIIHLINNNSLIFTGKDEKTRPIALRYFK
jgi:hypothetical protein